MSTGFATLSFRETQPQKQTSQVQKVFVPPEARLPLWQRGEPQ
jgi:hypothetical protein